LRGSDLRHSRKTPHPPHALHGSPPSLTGGEGRVSPAAIGALALLALALLPASASAQSEGQAYKPSRYDEDYRYLRDPARRTDVWDPIKYIPLGADPNTYLSLGGELRERFDHFDSPFFSLRRRNSEDALLHRLLLSADLHLGEQLRGFLQLSNHLQAGRGNLRSPTDLDRLDVQQAFLDFDWLQGPAEDATLRLGRQEIAFGSQRLVSVRESPNVRRSFDGARAFFREGEFRLDAFVTKPVQNKPGVFNDQPDESQLFWGLYAVTPVSFIPSLYADLYYLGLSRKNALFDEGVAHEMRHSFGTRLWGNPKPWDYNTELVLQVGSFGRQDILAWTAASDTGFTFEQAPLRPRLGLKANIASGDDNRRDGTLGTFNPLFPKNAYFTEADLVTPANFIDLYPTITVHPTAAVDVTTGVDFLWRESTHDAFYRVPLIPLVRGDQSNARFIGSEFDLEAGWQIDRHLKLNAAYIHFFAGPVVTNAGGKDVDYVGGWGSYKF
jgi:hypothetical protein